MELEKYPVYLNMYQMGIIVGIMLKIKDDKDYLPRPTVDNIMKAVEEAIADMSEATKHR